MLACLERIAYELGSGRRMEIADYLRQVVYKEVASAHDTTGAVRRQDDDDTARQAQSSDEAVAAWDTAEEDKTRPQGGPGDEEVTFA